MFCSSGAEIAAKISFSEKNGGPLPKTEACNCLQPSQEIRYIIVLWYIQCFSHKNKIKTVVIVLLCCNCLVSSRAVIAKTKRMVEKRYLYCATQITYQLKVYVTRHFSLAYPKKLSAK